MDEELRKQIYASARESYDRTLKWTSLAVVLAAMFHLVVYTRYIELARERFDAGAEQVRLRDVSSVMDEVGAVVKEIQALLSTTGKQVLEADLNGLRSDFVSFSDAIDAVRRGGDASPDSELVQENPDVDDVPNVAQRDLPQAQRNLPQAQRDFIQAQRSFDAQEIPNLPNIAEYPNAPAVGFRSGARALRRWNFAPEETDRIRAASRNDLLDAIRPIVEERIITPRFESLRRSWQTSVAAPAAEKAERIKALVEKHEAEIESVAPGFKQIKESVQEAARRAKETRIEPPQGRWWWETVGGKMQVYGGIRDDADNAVRSALQTSDVSAIESSIKRALDAKQNEVKKIEDQLKQLEESLKEQGKVLGAVSEPFKFLAADMRYVIMKFPLLIGLLWGLSAWQRGSGLARLASLGGNGDPAKAAQTLAALLGRWPQSAMSAAARTALGCAWVALAAWQFREMPQVGASAATLGAIGAAFALAGEGARDRLLRGAAGAVAS